MTVVVIKKIDVSRLLSDKGETQDTYHCKQWVYVKTLAYLDIFLYNEQTFKIDMKLDLIHSSYFICLVLLCST